jgi:ABC-type multidrug transport system fused ATPase/permease subunit
MRTLFSWIIRIPNDWLKHLLAPEVSCWTVAGERQSTRLRSLYLEAVLRQDIAFFDVEMTTAEAASRMSADTVLIQDALGEKVTIHYCFGKRNKNICLTNFQ